MRPRPRRLRMWKVRPTRAGTKERRADVPTRRAIPRLRASSQIMVAVAAILLLAGVVPPKPVTAQDDGVDILDAIQDLFSRPDDETVNVPKRRRGSPSSPEQADRPAAGQEPNQAPPVAAPAPETVADPVATGEEPDQPPPAAAPAPETGSIPEERSPVVVQPPPAASQAARPTEPPEPREPVSQSHVFRVTEDMQAEIAVLLAELATAHFPRPAEIIEGRAPVHVYAKSLEVIEKVTWVQRRLGLPPARMGHLPVQAVNTADVLDQVEYVLRELRSIKTRMAIAGRIEPAPMRPGSTSSMNYRNLADASLMLDGLVGRTLAPADVYRNALYILDELELVAAVLGVSLSFELAPVDQEITPADVTAQILRAIYRAINLQTRLQMEPSEVPVMTLVRVSPSESYDATNLLLAEIARIKAHLGVRSSVLDRPNLPMDQQSKDAFALVTLIASNIDRVAAAVGN